MAEQFLQEPSSLMSSTLLGRDITGGLTAQQEFDGFAGDWRQRLQIIVATMREMSTQRDPQAMVRAYAKRMRRLLPFDRSLSLSRRGLKHPEYRITRNSGWKEEINPWKSPERLPLLKGGLLSELIYADEPRVIDNLSISDDDPAAEYLEGMQSLAAIPLYDEGAALNMVLLMRSSPDAFSLENFPELVWMSNLFGRATSNLVTAERLEAAYELVDREMRAVADIQFSLLPATLPEIPGMSLAVDYRTSRRAGGDYYDFFALPDGRWGILIADVSGHGTPAAVMMAITHSIAHLFPGEATSPSTLLAFINEQLASRYTGLNGTFVTAFYGIFDPATRKFVYSSAGHNPPRLRRCACGTVFSLDGAGQLPLGVQPGTRYEECTETLWAGDRILFYTDGITEAQSNDGEMFGIARMDGVLTDCGADAKQLLARILRRLDEFTEGQPPADDRTLLVADVR